MRFRVTLSILALLYLFSTEPANALTCMDLDGAYVFSQEPIPVYLGFFGNAYASESIMNEYGTYGSSYSSSSVRNGYGTYGSPYSSYSANNNYTSTPPKVFKNGQLIAYLTTNTYTYGGVSLAEIDIACTFVSSSPAIDVGQPPSPPSWVIASDGLYDKISVIWGSVDGATFYSVYYAESLTGTKYLIGSTTATSVDTVDSVPDRVYYFWVSAANAHGQGLLSNPDSGYAKSAQTVSYFLIINKLGNAQGNVLSSPEGIKCGSICQYGFPDGSVVTLTAEAAQGVTFIGWSGEGCSGKGTCTVTMDAAKSVTATFERANSTNKGLPWMPVLLLDD